MGKAGEQSGGLSPVRAAENDDEAGVAKVQGLTLERKA